jgi:hypothetical protein
MHPALFINYINILYGLQIIEKKVNKEHIIQERSYRKKNKYRKKK